jgi:hypothetical protein
MRFFLAPVFACAIFFGVMRAAWAGPPYQTDDPVPVAYRNYEIYIGYGGMSTLAERAKRRCRLPKSTTDRGRTCR